MVEDTPDDLVHEIFTQGFWENHPLGPADSRAPARRSSRSRQNCYATISAGRTPPRNLIVSAVGNLEHAQVRDLVDREIRVAPSTARNVGRGSADRRAEDR